MTVQNGAQERQVAQQVEHLVPHELVAEAKGSGEHPGVVEHDRVVERAAAGEAAGATVSVFCSHATRRAALARMQIYFFIGFG